MEQAANIFFGCNKLIVSVWVKNFSQSETRQIEPHHALNILGAANKLHLTALQPKVINISWTHQMDRALQRAKSCGSFIWKFGLLHIFLYKCAFFSLTQSQKTVLPVIYILRDVIPNSFWILATFKLYGWLMFSFLLQTVPVGSQLRKSNVCDITKAAGSISGGNKRQEFSRAAQFV